MDVDEARHDYKKSNGIITLKIEKLSRFAREANHTHRYSDPIYVRGLPWKIFVFVREMSRRRRDGNGEVQKALGYFLQCCVEDPTADPDWGCFASAKLKLLAQKEGAEDYVREISHTLNAEENDWGLAQFKQFTELMDPDNGWYDQVADTIILRCEINAKMPYGIEMQYGIGDDMSHLFDKGDQYYDCTLVAGNTEFKVYKGILACRSSVFAAMFEHRQMLEVQNGRVDITDIRAEVLEQMLRYIYSGKEPNMENIAGELMIAAEKYELNTLKMFCERKLVNSLDYENACELLALASQHFAELLKHKAIKYIQENAKEVTKTDGWKMLLSGNYGDLVDQIVKAIIAKME